MLFHFHKVRFFLKKKYTNFCFVIVKNEIAAHILHSGAGKLIYVYSWPSSLTLHNQNTCHPTWIIPWGRCLLYFPSSGCHFAVLVRLIAHSL